MKRPHLHHLHIFARPAVFACICILSGCAGTRAPVTQQIDMPVAVSCVKAENVPTKPVYEFDKLSDGASDGAKVLALAGDWLRGRKYEGELEAVIAGCR